MKRPIIHRYLFSSVPEGTPACRFPRRPNQLAYILTDVRQDSNLRYKGELNPAAFAAATRKPDRHTLWNLLAHRGERTFKHPQRSSCIHRILKFSCLITEKKLRTQKSPQLFCISSRFLISPTKRSGSVTLINGPKESTRITSSVSSSCR